MFMAAIIASFWYLRTEEVDREQEALRRDVEYAQQRVRLRLLERLAAARAEGVVPDTVLVLEVRHRGRERRRKKKNNKQK